MNFSASGIYRLQSYVQWQPTLTAHDPNPPLTVEDAASTARPWLVNRTHTATVVAGVA